MMIKALCNVDFKISLPSREGLGKMKIISKQDRVFISNNEIISDDTLIAFNKIRRYRINFGRNWTKVFTVQVYLRFQ